MELVAEWGAPAVAARLRRFTDAIADGAARLGIHVLPPSFRVPHIIGLHLPGGASPALIEALRNDRVFVSERLGVLRISPHVWTTEADIDRLLSALR